ncbi:MAG: hypothetical protein ACR2HJ_04750 [Fimbriimonadales bacterium]
MKRYLMISMAAAVRDEIRVKTGFAHRSIGVAVCVFALATVGVGQVTEAWVARYDGPGNFSDAASVLSTFLCHNLQILFCAGSCGISGGV